MPISQEQSLQSAVGGTISAALGVSVGQWVYVPYRATAKSKPHVKRVKVLQIQATVRENGADVTILGEDIDGVGYVYPYDQLFMDINSALHFVTAQQLREDMGLDEFCHVVDPRFKFKKRRDGDAAAKNALFDPTKEIDEGKRQELLDRINSRVISAEYWKKGSRK